MTTNCSLKSEVGDDGKTLLRIILVNVKLIDKLKILSRGLRTCSGMANYNDWLWTIKFWKLPHFSTQENMYHKPSVYAHPVCINIQCCLGTRILNITIADDCGCFHVMGPKDDKAKCVDDYFEMKYFSCLIEDRTDEIHYYGIIGSLEVICEMLETVAELHLTFGTEFSNYAPWVTIADKFQKNNGIGIHGFPIQIYEIDKAIIDRDFGSEMPDMNFKKEISALVNAFSVLKMPYRLFLVPLICFVHLNSKDFPETDDFFASKNARAACRVGFKYLHLLCNRESRLFTRRKRGDCICCCKNAEETVLVDVEVQTPLKKVYNQCDQRLDNRPRPYQIVQGGYNQPILWIVDVRQNFYVFRRKCLKEDYANPNKLEIWGNFLLKSKEEPNKFAVGQYTNLDLVLKEIEQMVKDYDRFLTEKGFHPEDKLYYWARHGSLHNSAMLVKDLYY